METKVASPMFRPGEGASRVIYGCLETAGMRKKVDRVVVWFSSNAGFGVGVILVLKL
jgi:hypothetical protein